MQSDPTIARLGRLLHELMSVINERTAGRTLELLHDESLTMPQMVALHHLAATGPQTLGALGEALRLSTSATSSLAERMVERGLFERWENPDDRRQRLVTVSATGRALVDRMAAERALELQVAFASVDPALRTRMADTFEAVIAQLRAGGDR